MSHRLTVGLLRDKLQHLDPDLPVRLAVNPDWPFSHHVGHVAVGEEALYLADDGQAGHLPMPARRALCWT